MGTLTWQPNQAIFHPGSSNQYSFVRWIAPANDTYSLTSNFMGADFVGPTSTDVHILLNGSSLFSSLVNGFGASSTKSFSNGSLSLNAGDILDFAVGFGNNGNYLFDSTGIDVTISSQNSPNPTSVPETSSGLGVLALGFIGVVSAIKRKYKQKD